MTRTGTSMTPTFSLDENGKLVTSGGDDDTGEDEAASLKSQTVESLGGSIRLILTDSDGFRSVDHFTKDDARALAYKLLVAIGEPPANLMYWGDAGQPDGLIYATLSDDGQAIRKWQHTPFPGSIRIQ